MEAPAPAPEPTGLPGNVTRVEYDGREIFVLGTAHVSRKSVEEVRHLVSELRPDAVCVELDRARHDMLRDESRFRKLDVLAVLAEDRAGQMLASLLFSAFQKRLGDRLGVRPGAEMLAGVEEAERIGAKVVLADRDIQATLRRCYASLGALDRAKVVVALSALPFAATDLDEAEVERLKEREAISDAMSAFAEQMPALQVPLIDERDRYLIASTRAAPGKRILTIVGAAHVAGMLRHLHAEIDREALSVLPPAPRGRRVFVMPAFIVLVALVAGLRSGGDAIAIATALEPVALSTAVVAAVFVLAGGGGFVASAAAFLLAPLTVPFPFVPFGGLVGRVRAWAHPPSPDDAARVREDMLVPALLRKNAFIAVLLAAVTSRFGRSAGAVVGLVWAFVRVLRHH